MLKFKKNIDIVFILFQERARLKSLTHSDNQLIADEEYCKRIIKEDLKK